MKGQEYTPEQLERITAILAGTEWDPADVPDATEASEPFDPLQGAVGDNNDLGVAAGVAAWSVLAHHKDYASQIAALRALANDGPDVWGFVWSVASEAARLGYLFAQLPTTGSMKDEQAARMLAAMADHRILPDPAEPDERTVAA